HLWVRPDIRCRDVRIRPDDALELRREAAGHRLELLGAHPRGIDRDPTLRAAERDIDEGALPGHPHRECTDVVEIRRGVVTQTAFRGSPRHVVLDPVAGEYLDRTVV